MRKYSITRRRIKISCIVLILLGSGLIISDFAKGDQTIGPGSESAQLNEINSTAATPIQTNSAYQPQDYTVITSIKGTFSSAKEKGAIVVVNPQGEVVYHNHSYNVYDDVDMSPKGRWTFTYVAAKKLTGEDCAEFNSSPCTRNFIERLNVSTEETERLYEGKTAGVANTRWHDADRLDEHRFLLADIVHDRILIVNTTTDAIEWEWSMSDEFDIETTGGDRDDWAHLNDVEMLDNGYIMASPRNHDQVIFVKPGEGLNESMTVGEDENYDIMYEQHNPDYLTASGELPAVLVADSQNNRIVEFARQDGEWTQTWEWADSNLRWPRDADRLPNGNTLITDTNGHRVIEVSPTGELVWGVDIRGGYDAERLGTGEESAGGPPMTAVEDAKSKTDHSLIAKLPPILRLGVNGALFVLPPWVGLQSLVGGLLILVTGVTWIGAVAVKHRPTLRNRWL